MGEDAVETNFGRELRKLALTAFADGAEVSGERTVSSVPDRRVTVERDDEDKVASPVEVVGESS